MTCLRQPVCWFAQPGTTSLACISSSSPSSRHTKCILRSDKSLNVGRISWVFRPHFPDVAERDAEEHTPNSGQHHRLPRRWLRASPEAGTTEVERHSLPQIFERCAQLAFGQDHHAGGSFTPTLENNQEDHTHSTVRLVLPVPAIDMHVACMFEVLI